MLWMLWVLYLRVILPHVRDLGLEIRAMCDVIWRFSLRIPHVPRHRIVHRIRFGAQFKLDF
jgi:hypothetical protein